MDDVDTPMGDPPMSDGDGDGDGERWKAGHPFGGAPVGSAAPGHRSNNQDGSARHAGPATTPLAHVSAHGAPETGLALIATDQGGMMLETPGVDATKFGSSLWAWVGTRVANGGARFLDLAARGRTDSGDSTEAVALSRTGGPVARWVSFPRGVRTTTATTAAVALGLGAWGFVVFAGYSFVPGLAAIGAGIGLAASAGPIGVRMANRLHRLIARRRRYKISELRGLPDRRAVAVRGVVMATRTAASTLDTRPIVWSLTRFRRGRSPLLRAFFHEVAFDFMISDGTDEPIWIEVAGGMLIDGFAPDRRVQFHSTTLLDIDHPFLTRLRIRDRKVRAAEIAISPGDVVEVVGRLSRRLDPTAPSDSGREPPQRRMLRSGTRVPVMVRRILEPDLELARVRRLAPRGAPDASPGEPPVRKF